MSASAAVTACRTSRAAASATPREPQQDSSVVASSPTANSTRSIASCWRWLGTRHMLGRFGALMARIIAPGGYILVYEPPLTLAASLSPSRRESLHRRSREADWSARHRRHAPA